MPCLLAGAALGVVLASSLLARGAKDLLPDNRENELNAQLPPGAPIQLDTCNPDSDSDGVEDGARARSRAGLGR